MIKNELEMEENPRSFRCEHAIGKLIDKYADAWERPDSWVIRLVLRERFKDELPPELKPRNFR